MSLLDNLIEFSNFKPNGERASSLSLKSRMADEDKDEQPIEGRTSSKSLSKPVKLSSYQLITDNCVSNFSKSLYKLIFIMNKKIRSIKYFCFTKLQGYNKKRLWKSDSLKNLEKLTTSLMKIRSAQEEQLTKTMPQLPKPPSNNKNAEAIRRLVETYEILYLKYFSASQKQRIFSKIKKHSVHMFRLRQFVQPLLKHLQYCTYQNKRDGLNAIKDHQKQYLRVELLIDNMNSLAGKCLNISIDDIKSAFSAIHQHGIHRVKMRLQQQKKEIEKERQRLGIFQDNSLDASRDSRLSFSKLSLDEEDKEEKSEADREAEKALKRYAEMQRQKNTTKSNMEMNVSMNVSSNQPSSTDFQLQIQQEHQKFMKEEEERVKRQQEEIRARQQLEVEKARRQQEAIIQKQRQEMQLRQEMMQQMALKQQQMREQHMREQQMREQQMREHQMREEQMMRQQLLQQQMLREKEQEAIRLQMLHEQEHHRRLQMERQEQRMRKAEEQQRMRMKQLEEEREAKSRQKQSQEQRIRERLQEEIKIRQRLEQQLRNRDKIDEQNRQRRLEDQKRYREQSHSRQKSRSTAIDSHQTQPASELNRNYSQNQLRRHQTEYEANSPGITRTTIEDHRPTNFIKQNKALDERAADHHSLGRYSSSQRSQTITTPRIQSEAGLANQYFSREADTRRQDLASNQKPRRDISHPPLSIANSMVSEMEHLNKMGQSNKKKIVLSKKNPNEDSLDSRKNMTESILQKPLDTHSCSWSSQRYEVVTKLIQSPIKSTLRKVEHLPRAIYRLYPDQVSKQIQDIPDNIKLFLETSDLNKDHHYQGLQSSQVKSSFFGSESSGNMRYDGIMSQINRIKEQQSMQKASKLDNPSKFTSPADFFRSCNDSRPTIQRINAQQFGRPPLNTPQNINTQSQQLPVRDMQQGSPYLKQKYGNLGLNEDKFQQPSRPTDPLYISRKIKEACMDGRREDDYKEMSEKRKRTDSQTRIVRLTDPPKPAFDKSCSSDTKLRSMQMARPVHNPGAFTLNPQNTMSTYELSNNRRPNSEFTQFHRVTFDLNKVPLSRDTIPLPSTSLPVNSCLSTPQYYDQMAHTPGTLSASSSTSSFAQVPLTHSTYLQSKQAPNFFQSQYYFNRSKMLAQATSANLARHN